LKACRNTQQNLLTVLSRIGRVPPGDEERHAKKPVTILPGETQKPRKKREVTKLFERSKRRGDRLHRIIKADTILPEETKEFLRWKKKKGFEKNSKDLKKVDKKRGKSSQGIFREKREKFQQSKSATARRGGERANPIKEEREKVKIVDKAKDWGRDVRQVKGR